MFLFKFRQVFFAGQQPDVGMSLSPLSEFWGVTNRTNCVCRSCCENKDEKQKGPAVTKTISFAVIVGLIVVASSTADARGGPGGGGGASAFSPGQQFRLSGAVNGYPGASGYAPGHLKRLNGPVPGRPGASGYAPGHKFKNH